ncbi:MAG: GNAT family N-acetyltransferase [bacterium]|nr:GNAT family N-acetyltransferase [bacterium]
MDIQRKEIDVYGIKFYIEEKDKELGRAYLYILRNDLHQRPFGFLEDVFVDGSVRGEGLGRSLVQKVIEEARSQNCYKLICTSRYAKPKVHDLYLRLGFLDHGKEFRINF